jgi:hypothetical protein
MSEFKVGDKVRCVKGATPYGLIQGDIYTVSEVPTSFGTMRVMGNPEWFNADRFVPFNSATTVPQVADKINPSHYAQYPIQPITFIRALNLNHNRGAIVKYASRAGYKANEDAIDDLKKIIRYAEAEIKAIEIERGDNDWSKGI